MKANSMRGPKKLYYWICSSRGLVEVAPDRKVGAVKLEACASQGCLLGMGRIPSGSGIRHVDVILFPDAEIYKMNCVTKKGKTKTPEQLREP